MDLASSIRVHQQMLKHNASQLPLTVPDVQKHYNAFTPGSIQTICYHYTCQVVELCTIFLRTIFTLTLNVIALLPTTSAECLKLLPF